ncbi:hypothetical protein ACXJJ3_25320 [Kribbella sp. WER1]
MAGRESLRIDLLRCREEAPGALMMWSDPLSERRRGRRCRIDLAAWATDIAGELKEKYGDLVDLRVGALTYPAKELSVGEAARQLHGEPAEAAGLVVDALAPLTIRSGHFGKQDVAVPALIGTASLVPGLGYAVPPGRWGLVVSLQADGGGHLLSKPLELTVEPARA